MLQNGFILSTPYSIPRLSSRTKLAPLVKRSSTTDGLGILCDIGADLSFIEVTYKNIIKQNMITEINIMNKNSKDILFTSQKPLTINSNLNEGNSLWTSDELVDCKKFLSEEIEVIVSIEAGGNSES